uniref:Uncharacterized protein n=1 Tax=Octopus bimaculoides TaxID=37653 RepID=A0A0L8GZP2_OCTBM
MVTAKWLKPIKGHKYMTSTNRQKKMFNYTCIHMDRYKDTYIFTQPYIHVHVDKSIVKKLVCIKF